MKTLKIVVAGLLLVAGQAFGQAAVDAEQKAAVKELLDAMNFKQMMSQMGGAMMQQMPQMMDQMVDGMSSGAKLSPEQVAEAKKLAKDAGVDASRKMLDIYNDPQFISGVEDIMSRAYARHFTTAEIKATVAFYNSPAGRKALTVMPRMMQETMPEMMALISPRMNAIMESVAKDVVAKAEKSGKPAGAAK
ncbi:MAG: DUF2059 domain-containing protein [Betaproteobacteria bacterium]|nr:DUF2059 domain-containing protein [Betaproteobacteria bacterium]